MKRFQRGCGFESLEQRLALSATWHNELVPVDVDQDGYVSPRDALIVINELDARDFSDPTSAVLGDATTNANSVDVDADGYATPQDALRVINAIGVMPILDLNGDAPGLTSTVVLLGSESGIDLVGDEAVIRPEGQQQIHSVRLTWSQSLLGTPEFSGGNYRPEDIRFTVDTSGTNISAIGGAGSLALNGVDTAENYLSVMRTIRMEVVKRGDRQAALTQVSFEVGNGIASSQSRVFVPIEATQTLVGLPVDEAEEIANQSHSQVRLIRPGEAVTLDFVPDRMNLYLDSSDIVTRTFLG